MTISEVHTPDERLRYYKAVSEIIATGNEINGNFLRSRSWITSFTYGYFFDATDTFKSIATYLKSINVAVFHGATSEFIEYLKAPDPVAKAFYCSPEANEIEQLAVELSAYDSIYFSDGMEFALFAHHEGFYQILGLRADVESICGKTIEESDKDFLSAIEGEDVEQFLKERYLKCRNLV